MAMGLIFGAVDLGAMAANALMDAFVERLVEQAFNTAGNYASDAVSKALPDFSSLSSVFNDVSKLVDFKNNPIEDQKSMLRSAILNQVKEMDVMVVSNSELKALRKIAQVAEHNGDLKKALAEWKSLK